MAHDPGVGEEAGNLGLPKAGDSLDVEVGKGCSEVGPLAEDGQPGEAGLEPLETYLLEKPIVVDDRPTPFQIVVLAIVLGLRPPPAARDPVISGHQLHPPDPN